MLTYRLRQGLYEGSRIIVHRIVAICVLGKRAMRPIACKSQGKFCCDNIVNLGLVCFYFFCCSVFISPKRWRRVALPFSRSFYFFFIFSPRRFPVTPLRHSDFLWCAQQRQPLQPSCNSSTTTSRLVPLVQINV